MTKQIQTVEGTMTNRDKPTLRAERFVIITPNKRAFDEFCRSNELPPSKQFWIKNNDDIYKTYGLELSEKQIILLHDWYKIPNAQRVFERVREE